MYTTFAVLDTVFQWHRLTEYPPVLWMHMCIHVDQIVFLKSQQGHTQLPQPSETRVTAGIGRNDMHSQILL
jgi:hypothetical protein